MARKLLYREAEKKMRKRIASGKWPVDMRLGNEFELAEEFKVSQGTMRRALMTLEAEGLLSRKPGRGTIVAKPQAASAKSAKPKGHLVTAAGSPVSFEVHRAKARVRSVEAHDPFADGQLHQVDRLLKLRGNRAALEVILVSTDAIPDFDEDASTDLATALSDHGVADAVIVDQISADVTSVDDSMALACDRNAGLLCVTRTARDGAGQTIAQQVLRIAEPGVSYG